MSDLTPRERALVSLGAALGSNCVPCVQFHVPACKQAGLADSQISEAIRLADHVRQVPARKALETAIDLLPENSPGAAAADHPGVAPANRTGSRPACTDC